MLFKGAVSTVGTASESGFEGGRLPLLSGNFFSFVNMCKMVLWALLLKYIFFKKTLLIRNLLNMVSLPRGCALAAIALAPASIILLFVAFEIMFGRHICLRKAVQFHHNFTSNFSQARWWIRRCNWHYEENELACCDTAPFPPQKYPV